MARRSKDLFVILAERQTSRQPRSTREASAIAPREVGQTIGRWMRSAVETLRPGASGKPEKAKKSKAGKGRTRSASKPKTDGGTSRTALRGSGGRRAMDQPLPRGLLMPGWLLVGMLVVSLGGGFVIGRYTGGAKGEDALSSSRGGNRVSAPGPLGSGVRELSPEEEEDVRSEQFYVCGVFGSGERAAAATLARDLREHGVQNARIRLLGGGKASTSNWVTLCYAAPSDGDPALLAELQRLEGVLKFTLYKQGGTYLLRPEKN